ncbi:MAG: HAD family phosphatase [Proteobacteria bacterium]|nr:HAD family phosphatase [Pseudomonadota bacterium]
MFCAIFFDNDGVLVDTEKLYFAATREILLQNGVELTGEDFREFFLLKNIGAWHLIEGVTDAQITALRQARHKRYSELLKDGVPLIPGVHKTVIALARTHTLGIVTSSARDHFQLIHQRTNLLHHFSFVISREDYHRSKPDPEPYRLAIEKSGFKAAECLAVEDSERGLRAARAAGIACVVIPTLETKGSDFSSANRVLDNINELVELTDEIKKNSVLSKTIA